MLLEGSAAGELFSGGTAVQPLSKSINKAGTKTASIFMARSFSAEKRNTLFMILFIRGCQFSGGFFSLTADFFPAGGLGDGFCQLSQSSGNVDVLGADGCAGAASDAG